MGSVVFIQDGILYQVDARVKLALTIKHKNISNVCFFFARQP